MKALTAGLICLAVVAGCLPDGAAAEKVAEHAAAQAQEQAKVMKDKLRGTYDEAYAKGREIAAEVGEKASDQVLRAKVLAAFALMKNLDSSSVKVSVEKGVIHLDGTVKTEEERMAAEGLAYGVVGDGKRVRSTLTVPK